MQDIEPETQVTTPHGTPAELPVAPWFAVLVFVAIVAAHLFNIGIHPLAEPDEPRYAEIPREMLVSGDWITPRLNFVKYFEKPPLVYWLTAGSYRLLGVDEFAARLPALVCGLGMVLLVFALGSSLYGRATGLLAAIILGTSPFPAVLAQVLTLDTPLAFFMTLALAAVWFGHRSVGMSWYRVAYVAIALGILVKGPVTAVLVAGVAVVFLFAAGGWAELRRAFDGPGIALAAALTLPWFALVSWRNPEFLHFFIVDQHLKRFLWTEEHGQPFWFFLQALPVVLAPWSLLLFTDPLLWRRHVDPRRWSKETLFLVLWAVVVIGFFSVSKSKLLTYILPALPPLAILLARLCERALAAREHAFLSRGSMLLVVLGAATFLSGAGLGFFITHWRFPLVRPYLFAGGLLLGGVGYLARLSLARRGPRAALQVLTAGFVGLLALALGGRGLANSYRGISLAVAQAKRPGDRVVSYSTYVQSLPFYTGQRVAVVRYQGELDFGSHQGDQSAWFWGDDELRRAWSAPARMFLVVRPSELEKIDPPLDPAPVQIASEGKMVLVVNRGEE